MGILTLVELIANVSLAVLQNSGVIGSNTTNLITALMGPISTLITNLKNNGAASTNDVQSALVALSGVITTLETNTNLDPSKLEELKALSADVQAALAAYVESGKGIDLTVFTPLPTDIQ